MDLDYVAKVTHGFSGADLTEICQRVRTVQQQNVGVSLSLLYFLGSCDHGGY